MIDVETITLEDGIEYIITKQRTFNNTKYVLLTNINNSDDFCIKKVVNENNNELLVNLSNEEEFNEVFTLFL